MIKKSYNPFKMWGSYVGLVLYPLLAILLDPDIVRKTIMQVLFFPLYFASRIIKSSSLGDVGLPAFLLLGAIFTLISGFLIGWGIHSLIRKLRR